MSARPSPTCRDSTPPKVLHWIEIVLVDEEGRPVPDEPYALRLPDGALRTGRLGTDGTAFEGNLVIPGMCQVRFPAIDGREWRPA
jgi:type VI secretion system secreted protein VgrG